MSYPYFTNGLKDGAGTTDIPTMDLAGFDAPEHYRADPRTAHAVNAALILGRPLLVTGEPGVGKTQLAYAIAHNLGLTDLGRDRESGAPAPVPRVHKFETKSTSQARDLFYTFDAVSALKSDSGEDRRLFIEYQALGKAILESFPSETPELAQLLTPQDLAQHRGPRRSVVLIDEIDKAPRDFPNDLLNEIDRLYFKVPELQRAGSPGAANSEGVSKTYRPIVVLTSNSEKSLPEPFLRRCLYCHIEAPSPTQLKEIVEKRVASMRGGGKLLETALDLFDKLRDVKSGASLRKPPSTAELLDWLYLLGERSAGERANGQPAVNQALFADTLYALTKSREDAEAAQKFLAGDWSKDRDWSA